MIHFLSDPPLPCHTDRSYLTQWFAHDILVITDVDINQHCDLSQFEQQVRDHRCAQVIVDLSHNQMPHHEIPEFLRQFVTLGNYFTDWYGPGAPTVHYFPLWFWMFSTRSAWLTEIFGSQTVLDAGVDKCLPMMCLNRNPHAHRATFRSLLEPIRDQIVYSWADQPLPGDHIGYQDMVQVDPGVGHAVYNQCAVNIVTETVMNRPALSEKTVKPFVAQQIPVIVGPVGTNQFCQDLGLDMFSDLVPWSQWDLETDPTVRMQLTADFVIEWHRSGSVLGDYARVVDRVQANKHRIHSMEFQQVIMRRMTNLHFEPAQVL